MMRIKTTFTVSLIALFSFAGVTQAAPPKPLPNPDGPAVTPRMNGDASVSASRICPSLRRLARSGNSNAGLMVKNLASGDSVCGLNAGGSRSLASNTKIFTTAASLARLGPDHKFRTRLYADSKVNRNGVLQGSLYLKGGGDPALGQEDFLAAYTAGAGSAIEKLAIKAKRAGVKRVTGRLYGDDGVFDRLRGVADSGFATSPYIGPLSGLSINAGYTSASFSRFSSDPAKLATKTLVRELRKRGISIRPEIAMKKTPRPAQTNLVARQVSPDMTWMARTTNLNSNNFFAEMLLKNLGAQVRESGTTRQGAIVVKRYAASLGVDVSPIDGSGLTFNNRSTPADVVKLLAKVRTRSYGDEFIDSLPVAGRDGTIGDRMRGSAAEGRCHAKTGTLTGVSALSGYCFNSNGRKFAFSILMNGVYDLNAAQRGQDRIAALIARL